MRHRIGWTLSLVFGVFVVLSMSCGDKSTEPEVPSLTRMSGDQQEGTLGATLDPLVVVVTDSKGRPMEGRRVDFAIVQGDGKLSVESAITDASGRASTVLTLGDRTGQVQVKATVFGYDESVVFTATVLSSDTIISQAAVKVGGEDSPFRYVSMSEDLVTFAIDGPAPQIKAGDIMVNTTEPYFLKKVVRTVRQTGGELVVETRQASLTEVVRKASIEETFSIPASPKLLVPSRIRGAGIGFDGTTIVSNSDINLSITSGQINFSPEHDFALEIDDWRMKHFKLAAGGQLSANIELRLEALNAVSVTQELTLVKIPDPPHHFVFWAGWVPVVIGVQIQFDVGAGVGAAVAGTITSGFSVTKEVQIGVEYENGLWQPLKGADPRWEAGDIQVGLMGTAAIRGFVEAQVNVEFYDVAGPHFGLQPYLEFATSVETSQQKLNWNLGAGVDAFVGAHVEILDHMLASYTTSFEWARVTIGEGEIDLATPNQPPVASISDPTDGSAFTTGDRITFRGTVSDSEDGSLIGNSLVWSSSRDGQLGTGTSLSTSTLSAGTHTITLRATDSKGISDSASISVTIRTQEKQAPVASITSPSDGSTFTEGDPVTFWGSASDPEDGSLTGNALVWTSDRDDQLGTGTSVSTSTLSVGTHKITLTARDSEGASDSKQVTITVAPRSGQAMRSLIIVLDLSSSMDGNVPGGGQSKLDAAKDALEEVLSGAPSDGSQEYALVTFGGSCEVWVTEAFTTDPLVIVTKARGLSASGSTPLAAAIRKATELGESSASSDDVQVVLLTDGVETCSGDPEAAAAEMAGASSKMVFQARFAGSKRIRLNVIGFGLEPGSNEEEQLKSIAHAANGNYFRASEVQDLSTAIGHASGLRGTGMTTLSGQVFNAVGEPIQGAVVRLRDYRENTDANGRYMFPNSEVQGVDSLTVEASGYLRYAVEVYVFGANKTYDVELAAAELPVAHIEVSKTTVESGETVILRGGNSTDPSGRGLMYHWSQVPTNPLPVSFSMNNSKDAFAVSVTLTELGEYRFVLVVDNGLASSAPDTVSVKVRGPFTGIAYLPGGAMMEIVWIPPGTFTMGSPSSEPGRGSDEGPQHEVTISQGFYLGKYEITQGQWESVMGTRPWSGKSYVRENANHPAVYISWNDVQEFIRRLNNAEGSEVYRLPTEAEWEYACRAGTTTRWSFGDDESELGRYAWYWDNAWTVGERYAHAVGTKLANPWGLYDMHGNVYEWCRDWYGSYSSSSQVDPTGPSTGSSRVIRGGAFYRYAQYVRSANRYDYSPDYRSGHIGARLLRQGQ